MSVNASFLVLNCGSSSIKFSLFESGENRSLCARAHGEVAGIGIRASLTIADEHGREIVRRNLDENLFESALGVVRLWCATQEVAAATVAGIGHRVVHGGFNYTESVLVDAHVLDALQDLVPLAPLHQPHNLAAIRAMMAADPSIAQVACFDTAFHADQPAIAREFGLPRELTAKGIRRYGFHGLSYEYIVSALAHVAPELANAKLIVAHLGNGASMCAIDRGRSVACSMGFSVVDGLLMGTRSGALDPGVILYLLQHEKMQAGDIENMIYRKSGLLGVSGMSGDMRVLLESRAPAAEEAVALFIYRAGRELGSLVAALGGLDALIFTGGIGEHAAPIRARVCENNAWLGLKIDLEANVNGGPRLSGEESKPSIWMIPTNENLMIARHTQRLLGG